MNTKRELKNIEKVLDLVQKSKIINLNDKSKIFEALQMAMARVMLGRQRQNPIKRGEKK